MTLRLGYGPITVQRGREDQRPWGKLYADALDLAVRAEQAGFDSVWVGEHHFTRDGYLPAVFPFLAALATRTNHVALGTKVVLAPLHHPLRIAEDAASVSLLSHGRLILGLAIGYRREEFDAFGRDRSQRAALLTETVEVARHAWTGEPFTYHGPTVDVEDLRVLPAPGQIPIWLGGRAPAALARAGQIADGFVAPAGPLEDLRRQVATVDAEAAAAGRSAPPVSSTMNVLVGTRPLPAVERGFLELLDGYRNLTSVDNPTTRIGQRDARATVAVEGDPVAIAEQIVARESATGPARDHHVSIRLDYPGMSHRDAVEHLDRFVTQVMPLLPRAS